MKIKRMTKKQRREKCRRTRRHGIDHEAIIASKYFTKGVDMGASVTKRAVHSIFMNLPSHLPDIMRAALANAGLALVPDFGFGWKENWPGESDGDPDA